jgi:hypothetical protein
MNNMELCEPYLTKYVFRAAMLEVLKDHEGIVLNKTEGKL